MTVLLVADLKGPLTQAGQFILSLSIIIILHEMGHFLPAKWFKCRVEKFMLFFDAGFSLFKKKIGDTVYGLGWLPLGGYVKISGMIDESMDKEALKLPPQPYEFRSKPAWQRLIIMAGGVTMNVLLAFVLFAVILQVWGDTYLEPKNATYGLYADSLGRKIGLQTGDRIMSIDGKPVKNEEKVVLDIFTHEGRSLQVERNGQMINLPIPEEFIGELSHNRLENFAEVAFPSIVDTVKTANIIQGELKRGDRVISLNDIPTPDFETFTLTRIKYKKDTVNLGLIRGMDTVHIKAVLDTGGAVGFIAVNKTDSLLTFTTIKYGFFESFPAGVRKSAEVMSDYVAQLKLLFTNKHVKSQDSLGSVVSMAKAYRSTWNWETMWRLTAFLSVILGFMNILPIPALDGGHILFLLVEMITGRKPGDKFLEYAQIAGMVLLLGLMAYALGLDIFRIFKH
jgi:regulator of sigma E protease